MDKRITIVTQDGSPSLWHPNIDETYHSRHGAVQESMHVFVEKGLNYILKEQKSEISIFEMGFGTGLNALLTILACKNLDINVKYFSLEKYPLAMDEVKAIDFSTAIAKHFDGLFSTQEIEEVYKQIHDLEWGISNTLNENFELIKVIEDIKSIDLDKYSFDLVYYDAFAPRVQPNLWSKDIFEKLYHQMNNNSALVTYCAKGEVRRNMQEVGFVCERLQGPPGKREMLRANKPKQ